MAGWLAGFVRAGGSDGALLRYAAVLLMLVGGFSARAAQAAQPVGVVSNIKVLSDIGPDVSSLSYCKPFFLMPGMTEQKKALPVCRPVVTFRTQDAPPQEYLEGDGCVHDPIKTFNVYGYNMCCCASSNIAALARTIGLPARIWTIRAHLVPEVQ